MRGNNSSQLYIAERGRGTGARLRLFCLHHAGGRASAFRQWAADLPQEIEVCPILLPGHEGRMSEAPHKHLSALVEELGDSLAKHLGLPFALFGHSMGAVVCFELARSLRRKGVIPPLQLFVSSHRAPHLPAARPPIHALPTPLFLEKIKELNGTPEAVLREPELMQFFLPVLRADFELLETYSFTADAPLDSPISAFGGLGDRTVSEEELAEWGKHTHDAFKVQMFPGDHFFLNHARRPLMGAIAANLLDRASQV